MIPFKLTKKKLKQLLPPPELVLQAGLLPGAPRHLAKLFPGLGRLFSSFCKPPCECWAVPRGEAVQGVYLFSLPAGLWEHSPAFLTAIPSIPRPCYQQRFCCLGKEDYSLREAHVGILRQRAHPWRPVMMCCNARHILRRFPLSALTLPHYFLVCCFFFYCFQC